MKERLDHRLINFIALDKSGLSAAQHEGESRANREDPGKVIFAEEGAARPTRGGG